MNKSVKIIILIIVSILGLAVVKAWEMKSGTNLTWILAVAIVALWNSMFRKNKNDS